jgi:hypothetical protein
MFESMFVHDDSAGSFEALCEVSVLFWTALIFLSGMRNIENQNNDVTFLGHNWIYGSHFSKRPLCWIFKTKICCICGSKCHRKLLPVSTNGCLVKYKCSMRVLTQFHIALCHYCWPFYKMAVTASRKAKCLISQELRNIETLFWRLLIGLWGRRSKIYMLQHN